MILSILLLVACLLYVLVVRLRPGKLFTVAIHRLFLQQRVRLKIHRNCVNRIEVQGASIRFLHFLTSVAFIFSFMCFFNREIMQHVDNNITLAANQLQHNLMFVLSFCSVTGLKESSVYVLPTLRLFRKSPTTRTLLQ